MRRWSLAQRQATSHGTTCAAQRSGWAGAARQRLPSRNTKQKAEDTPPIRVCRRLIQNQQPEHIRLPHPLRCAAQVVPLGQLEFGQLAVAAGDRAVGVDPS
jgi:hypothetical protein